MRTRLLLALLAATSFTPAFAQDAVIEQRLSVEAPPQVERGRPQRVDMPESQPATMQVEPQRERRGNMDRGNMDRGGMERGSRGGDRMAERDGGNIIAAPVAQAEPTGDTRGFGGRRGGDDGGRSWRQGDSFRGERATSDDARQLEEARRAGIVGGPQSGGEWNGRDDRRGQGYRNDEQRGRFDNRGYDGNRGYDYNRGYNGNRGYDNNRGYDYNRGYEGNRGYDYNRGYNNYGNENWNRDWRRDQRFDWQRYRYSNRNLFRGQRYAAPYGYSYGYRRFSVGLALNSSLFGQQYWVDDPYNYRLPPAYGAYRWVRYYNDVLLVDLRSGRVVDAIYDFFW